MLVASNLERAGFAHGFTTRRLDFGATAPPEARAAYVREVGAALGFAPEVLRQVHQVHGARVVRGEPDMAARPLEEADAIVAAAEDVASLAVAVRVADCVPVLVGDRRIGAVAAIHAGWRGVVAGVVPRAMAELVKFASGDYVAAIGPCIGACCFEVSADVATRIVDSCGGDASLAVFARHDGGDVTHAKARVDLRRAVRAQLAAAGVHDVEDVPGCTKCDAARFFSYRRDGEASGRHMAVIVARTAAPGADEGTHAHPAPR
jgi:YfiH family protein